MQAKTFKNYRLHAQASALLPTQWGNFRMIAFAETPDDWRPTLVLISEKTDFSNIVNLRIHSECITGEVFQSKKCECGAQLSQSMQEFAKRGGILIYLRQEGRNIGIINKLKAYALQEQGHDTVEANLQLGLPADARDFDLVFEILEQLGISKIRLFTNNPDKISVFDDSKITLVERVPLQIKALPENAEYLATKKKYFKHLLD